MKIDAFYSDPHFGHANIIKFCDRPFENAHDMTSKFIEKYNKSVTPENTVLWCGDCFFKCSRGYARDVMDRLHGHKILVRGNHDRWTDSVYMNLGFSVVLRELVICIAGIRVRVSHFPYYSTALTYDTRFIDIMPRYQSNEILIHGHTHSKEKITGKNSIHVGVDAWNYKPASIREVEKLILSTRNKNDLI